MMIDDKVKLWEAIDAYVTACGGDTSGRTVSAGRMRAVVDVERVVDEIAATPPEARGPFVPHAEVQAMLAQRAYAEDAPFLFAVYQAAMRVREASVGSKGYRKAIDAMEALLDGGKVPADPRDAEIARLRDEASDEQIASRWIGALSDPHLARAMKAERERDEARAENARMRRELAEAHAGLDVAREEQRRAVVLADVERARADAMRDERECEPAGHRVAGLRTALNKEAVDAQAEHDEYPHGVVAAEQRGYANGLRAALANICDALPAPSPIDRVVAEVVALDQRHRPDSPASPADYLDHIETLATDETPMDLPWEDIKTDCDRLKWIAAMALAGLMACDAQTGGAS